jgi:hypothetical protein
MRFPLLEPVQDMGSSVNSFVRRSIYANRRDERHE